MTTSGSSWVPSGSGQQQLMNAIIAYANLREKQESGEALRAYRESLRLKSEQEKQAAYDAGREKDIKTEAAALFGQKYDEAMEPALKVAREALASTSSRITAPVKGSEVPGLGVPNLVSRPPTVSDVSTIARPGAEGIRGDYLSKLRALGVTEEDPLYQHYKTSPTIQLPGQAASELETTSKARQERTKAAIGEETKPAEVARLKAQSDKEVALAAKSKLELQKEEAAAPYYKQNADAEAKIKQNDLLISDAKVKNLPEEAKKLQLENEQLQGNITKNNLEIQKIEHINGLINAYHRTSDPNVREKIYRDIALANGQTPQLLAHDLQTQKTVLDATAETVKLRVTGQAQLNAGQYEEGLASYHVANQHAIQAAKLNKSPTVQIVVPRRNKNWWRGETMPTTGSAKTDTRRAEMFINGQIDAVANGQRVPTGNMVRLEPGLDPEPEYYNQADGVAWKAYYENLPIATDIKEITKVIGDYNIPPEMKERALLKYQAIRGDFPNEAVVVESPTRSLGQTGLKPLTEDERKVPRNWAGTVSQPTRGLMAPPASSTGSQLPEGTKVGLPEGAKFKPASKEQNRAQFTPIIDAAADKYGIDKALFHKLVDQESQYNPYAKSKEGAFGLTQLMPDTARELKVDPTNPRQNVEGGARYLRQLIDRYGGDIRQALIAYNWGMGNYERARQSGNVTLPAETQDYLAKVLK